jgi:hypothetical protein
MIRVFSPPNENSKPIFIDLNPVAIGILQINLFHAVGPKPDLTGFAVAGLVSDSELVQMVHEIIERRNSEGKMHLVALWGFAARNKMELIMFPDFEPDVSVVLKGIWNNFSVDNVTIKRSAPLQIGYVQSNVIKATLHMLSETKPYPAGRDSVEPPDDQGTSVWKPPAPSYFFESKLLSALGSVTGALQVKFSQT